MNLSSLSVSLSVSVLLSVVWISNCPATFSTF